MAGSGCTYTWDSVSMWPLRPLFLGSNEHLDASAVLVERCWGHYSQRLGGEYGLSAQGDIG